MADEEKTVLIKIDLDNASLAKKLGETKDRIVSLKDTQKIFVKEMEQARGTDAYEFLAKKVGETTNEIKRLGQEQLQTSKLITATNEESITTVQQLRESIRAYTGAALEAGMTTPIGKEFIAKAAEAKEKLDVLLGTVNQLAKPTFVLNGLVGAARGVAAGFEVAAGATALFGNKNEALEKTIRQVGGAIALVNGLKEIQELLERKSATAILFTTIAQKAQTAAMALYGGAIALLSGEMTIATAATNILNVATKALLGPIGIVLGVLGAVIGAVMLFSSTTGENTEEVIKNTKATQENENAKRELEDRIQSLIDKQRVQRGEITKGDAQLNEIQRKQNDETIKAENEKQNKLNDLRKEFYDGETQATVDQLHKAGVVNMEYWEKKTALEKEFNKEQLLRNKAQGLELQVQFDENVKTEFDAEIKKWQDKFKAEDDAKKKAGEEWKKAQDEIDKHNKEEQAKLDKFLEEIRKAKKKGAEEQQKDLDEQLNRITKALFDNHAKLIGLEQTFNDNLDKMQQSSVVTQQGLLDQETQNKQDALENQYRDLLKNLDTEKQLRIQNIEETGESEIAIQQDIETKKQISKLAFQSASDKIDEQANKAKRQMNLDAAKSTLGDLNTIFEGHAEAQKAIAVAQTTIATYESATKAYDSLVGIPVVGPVLAPIAAGIAVAAGIANVNKIINTNIPPAATGLLVGSEGPRINRSNGDNMLVTVATGEVILNKYQQDQLGGDATFRKLGVPGFADGGRVDNTFAIRNSVGDIDARFETLRQFQLMAESLPNPVVSVEEILSVAKNVTDVKSRVEI